MKTVVFAYHDMGCLGIEALLAAGYEISAIFTHTDNPGEKAFYGSVARLAAERGIPVYATDDVNHPLWVERIAQLSPDVIFSFYYRHLICDEILQLAPAGAFNLHGSLLPKYRGRAPLNWVLVNGETETGVTLHRMVKRADAGAIVAQLRIAIAPDDIAITLHHKLCHAARQLLEQTLPAIKHGNILEIAQRENEATCFGRRTPDDSFLEWHKPGIRTAQHGTCRCRSVAGCLQLCWQSEIHRLVVACSSSCQQSTAGERDFCCATADCLWRWRAGNRHRTGGRRHYYAGLAISADAGPGARFTLE